MKKYIVTAFAIICAFMLLAGCTSEPVEEEYTLTAKEQKLVDFAYANRSVWESSKTGKIRYVRKNGYDFLLVSNSKGQVPGLDGEPTTVWMETKYTLNIKTGKVYEAHLDEYGSGDTGLVRGSVSYSSSSGETAKRQALGKAISGKSGVINPAPNR